MKGYFSQLSRSTGLRFEGSAARGLASSPLVNKSRRPREEVAPLHVESVRFTPAAESPTANSALAAFVGPDASGVSTGEASDSSGAQNHSGRRSSMAPDAIVRLPNQTASVERGEASPRSTFEESEVISTAHPSSEATAREFFVEKQPPAAAQPTIEFSEMSLHEAHQETALPRSDPSVLITPEGSTIRADAEASEGKERSLARPRPSFEFSESSFAQASDPIRFLESVAEVETALEGPADRSAQAKPVNHFELEGQRLEGDSVADSHSAEDQPDREAIVRNYMKEVRAWVAASPELEESSGQGSERDTGLEVWAATTAKQRDVFSLEYEAVEPQIQDLSLSIGNISIVVEEPKKDAAPPAPALPPVERSHARAESEPTRLSRYYLRPW